VAKQGAKIRNWPVGLAVKKILPRRLEGRRSYRKWIAFPPFVSSSLRGDKHTPIKPVTPHLVQRPIGSIGSIKKYFRPTPIFAPFSAPVAHPTSAQERVAINEISRMSRRSWEGGMERDNFLAAEAPCYQISILVGGPKTKLNLTRVRGVPVHHPPAHFAI
jgi:hypothetical protein